MANLKLKNPSGGSLNLVSADGASDLTVTFPAGTGTAMVSGNMPAFSAYKSSNQSFSSSTWTKVTLDLEMFDTNNNFASSTFTPTVAGYYQINAGVALSNLTAYPTSGVTGVYKNGLLYLRGLVNFGGGTGAFNDVICNASAVIYMNGTSDYLELYAYQVAGGTPQIVGNSDTYQTHFSGVLVRAA
jgi:hypothetical protein